MTARKKLLHPAKAQDVIKALVKRGFFPRHSKGSHVLLRHPDGRTTVVPVHPREELDRRLLRKISADISMNAEEFMFLIDEA